MTRPTNLYIRQMIERAFRAVGVEPGKTVRAQSLRSPAVTPAAADSLEWILSTEQPAMVWDWERWDFVSEVLIADGMLIPKNGQVPLQDSHLRRSTKDTIGHVSDFSSSVIDGFAARVGMVFFAADAESQIVRQKVIDGHITDGSVGYQVIKSIFIPEGMTASVAGKSYSGPLKISTEWILKEFSVTPIGADDLAKVRRMCGR